MFVERLKNRTFFANRNWLPRLSLLDAPDALIVHFQGCDNEH